MASKKVDINKAGIEDLQTLHGIGPARAKTIIEARQTRCGFKNIEDLLGIKGFGLCLLKRNCDILICTELPGKKNDREVEDLQFSAEESINKGVLQTQLQINHDIIKALKSQLDGEILKNKELQEQLESIKAKHEIEITKVNEAMESTYYYFDHIEELTHKLALAEKKLHAYEEEKQSAKEKEIQKFSALEKELEMKTAELKLVRQELTEANYQLRQGGHGNPMPVIDRSSQKPGKRRCSGLPQNNDDIDVIIMSEEVGIICPYTQSIMKEPVKNRICRHRYEKCAIEDFIIRRNGFAKCPYIGCGNSKPLRMLDLEPDYLTENHSKQVLREQRDIIYV